MALNENQALLGRCYFALNRHETDATAINAAETIALFGWLRRAKSALDRLFAPEHYNYVMLMNVEPHVHAHIIPRFAGPREFGGVTFVDEKFGGHYDPNASAVLSVDDFDSLVGEIRRRLPDEATI